MEKEVVFELKLSGNSRVYVFLLQYSGCNQKCISDLP